MECILLRIPSLGLCFKCGERWGREHTSSATVHLHVMEELMQLFGIDAAMSISRQALTGGVSRRVHFTCRRGCKATR